MFDHYKEGPDEVAAEPEEMEKLEVGNKAGWETEAINLECGETITAVEVCSNPEKAAARPPVFYFKGMAATAGAQEKFIHELAGDDRRVLAVNEQYGVNILNLPEIDELRESGKLEGFPRVELERVVAAVMMLRHKGIDKVDVVSQSAGSIEAVILAKLFPGMVNNMVLVSPAGMIGKDSPNELRKRFFDNIAEQKKQTARKLSMDDPRNDYRKDGEKKEDLEHLFEVMSEGVEAAEITANADNLMEYIKKDPRRAWESFMAIANADIAGDLEEIRKTGVKVGIVTHADDQTFPAVANEKYPEAGMREAALREGRGIPADGFATATGPHSQFVITPKKHAALIRNLLDNFETDYETEIDMEAFKEWQCFMGHRGMGKDREGLEFKENTLESLGRALYERWTGLEFDVQRAPDGSLRLSHGEIGDDYEKYSKFEDLIEMVKAWQKKFGLKESLDVELGETAAQNKWRKENEDLSAGYRAGLELEPENRERIQKVIDILKKNPDCSGPEVKLICFNINMLKVAREMAAKQGVKIQTGFLFEHVIPRDLFETAKSLGITWLVPDHKLIPGKEWVQAAKKEGFHIGVWTVDDPDRVKELREWGVEKFTTNRADLFGQPKAE